MRSFPIILLSLFQGVSADDSTYIVGYYWDESNPIDVGDTFTWYFSEGTYFTNGSEIHYNCYWVVDECLFAGLQITVDSDNFKTQDVNYMYSEGYENDLSVYRIDKDFEVDETSEFTSNSPIISMLLVPTHAQTENDGMDEIKKMKNDGEISEDDQKRLEDEVQKLTDSAIEKVDNKLAEKEKDIMTV